MKKTMAVLLVAVLLFTYLPTSVFAMEDYTCNDYADCTKNGEIYIITTDNAPIRKEPSNSGKVVGRAQTGQLICVKKVFRTIRLTRWCEISVDNGDSVYIHLNNCKPHVHTFATLMENGVGLVNYCSVCGVAEATVNGEKATCDFACFADQALGGSFSNYSPTFASLIVQIIAAEAMGPVADIRDIIGDFVNCEPGWVIALDLVALLPVIGALKYSDEIAVFGKNTDNIADSVKHLDEVGGVSKYVDEIVSIASKTDSSKLASNMHEAYKLTGKDRFYDLSDYIFTGRGNVAAHHIVAGGANNQYAKDSRALLAYVGIDINDSLNGVFLVSKAEFADVGALHLGRHAETYFKNVHDRLFNAVSLVKIPENADYSTTVALHREAVIEELDNIAEALMSGDLLLQKTT